MKKLKKPALILFVITLLLLDFAALDDITTGNEPDFTGEYLALIASLIVFAILVYKMWIGRRKTNE